MENVLETSTLHQDWSLRRENVSKLNIKYFI